MGESVCFTISLWRKEMRINSNIPTRGKKDFLRPRLHFTAPYGWLNDPNGLIYYKGQYHLFYQHLPGGVDWENVNTCWGHAVSDDLLNWTDLPIALAPDQPYDDYLGGGCWSGSSIEHEGKLYVFYTGCVGEGDTLSQTQNLAISEDGINFKKYEGNPIIDRPPDFGTADFRDPKVFRHEGRYYMVVAGSVPQEGEAEPAACVYLYRSDDLYHWEYLNIVIGPTREYGTMIECPDCFQLGDKWVLSVCLMNNLDYKSNAFFIGDLDFSSGKLEVLNVQVQDLNGYWYAPQTFAGPNGERLQMCWQNTTLWMQWFDDWGPTQEEGWRNCISLPHILTLDKNNHILSRPIAIDSLMNEDYALEKLELSAKPTVLHCTDPFCYELCFEIVLENCFSGAIELGLAGHGARYTKLAFNLPRREMVLDIKDRRDPLGSGTFMAELPKTDRIRVRLQFDRSSLEVCLNDDTHFVACVYPEENQNELWIRTPYTTAEVEKVLLMSLKTGPCDEPENYSLS